jgi:alpha-L-fucosidase
MVLFPSLALIQRLGRWVGENGTSIYDTQRSQFLHGDICAFNRRGNTLYVHVYYWPGEIVTIGGVTTTVRSVKLLASGNDVSFTQKGRQLILSGLPKLSPDELITVFAIACESEPVQHALSSKADEG